MKYVILADGSATANASLVDVSSLAYALNTNSQVMNANANIRSSYTTTIKRIWGAGKTTSGYGKLQWASDTNTEIVILPNGPFDYNFDTSGVGGSISNPTLGSANTTGDILYSLQAPSANDAFTVFLEIHKDNKDFDSGQTADPVAFNR